MKSMLLPPADREVFGQQIVDWAAAALRYYGGDNWDLDGANWRCLKVHPKPGAIDYQAGEISMRFDFDRLENRLLKAKKNALKRIRVKVLSLASHLLQQGDAGSRQQLRELKLNHIVSAIAQSRQYITVSKNSPPTVIGELLKSATVQSVASPLHSLPRKGKLYAF